MEIPNTSSNLKGPHTVKVYPIHKGLMGKPVHYEGFYEVRQTHKLNVHKVLIDIELKTPVLHTNRNTGAVNQTNEGLFIIET